MKITILDLGSTTIHAQQFEVDSVGQFHTRVDERRVLNLGHDVYRTGRIGEGKWNEAVATVGALLDATRGGSGDVTVAVATSAIRDAANGLALRVELWNRYRVGVQLLAPEEEARFAYLGATTAPSVGGRRVAVLDLGGGSLELAVGEGTRCMFATSVPLGALSVGATLNRAHDNGAIDCGRVHECVRSVGREVFSRVHALRPEQIVFASGTARGVRRHLMQDTSAPGKVGFIDAATMRESIGDHGSVIDRATGGHVDDAVLVARSIMLAAMDLLHFDRAIVSDKGLRDGVALDVYRRAPHVAPRVAARAPTPWLRLG